MLSRSGGVTLLAAALIGSAVGVKLLTSHAVSSSEVGFRGIEERGEVDLLLLGSSHTRKSYNLEIVERESGRDAYMLSYAGMQPWQVHLTLQYLIEDLRIVPRTVVVDVYWETSRQEMRLSDVAYFYHAPPRLKRRIVQEYASHLPSPWERLSWSWNLLVGEYNEAFFLGPLTNGLHRRTSRDGGKLRFTAASVSDAVLRRSPVLTQDEAFFRFHPVQLEYWHRAVELLADHAIDARFVQTPMPRMIYESVGPYDAMHAGLESMLAAAGFPYYDFNRIPAFDYADASYFLDDNHLNGPGGELFSGYVGRHLLGPPPTRLAGLGESTP